MRVAPVKPRYSPQAGQRYGADRGGGIVHYGIDLAAEPGTPVYAPEGGIVAEVAVNAGTVPGLPAAPDGSRLGGYGPGAVLLRGDSGVWHVLGHLDSWAWSNEHKADLPRVGQRFEAGAYVGRVSRLRHLHWEVRAVAYPPRGPERRALTVDPVSWLAGGFDQLPEPDRTRIGMILLLAIAALTKDKR